MADYILPGQWDQLWNRYHGQGDSTGNIGRMATDMPGLEGDERIQAIVNSYDQLHHIVQAHGLTS
ncbi:hypothetical protein DN752_23765 [Echinicola strongylocentroti]|uniref:Uncharacterized protein n=1 Tax=Echinicola strongylocentroti TaxID=1795355 RepID=A0A2Z4IRI6_9BACT|nr:hypothetical protein [Echinicola strongylocentroti]AWW32903.1 hypothetical protein DN752_23765 [Echinicola strongylocentroti]